MSRMVYLSDEWHSFSIIAKIQTIQRTALEGRQWLSSSLFGIDVSGAEITVGYEVCVRKEEYSNIK